MKKFISIAVSLLLIALTFVGCGEKFDFTKTADRLEQNGYRAVTSYDTEYEIEQMTRRFNEAIYDMGGDFQVEITRYVSFLKDDDHSLSCTLVEFATEEQAKNYTELFLFSREKHSTTKIARSQNIVVYTDSVEVQRNIDLEFR